MSFGLRGGSFGSGNLNPFGSNTGGFGQYNIGSSASEEASLDKYAAQVAWNQGRISDGAYIKALEVYAGTTSKGTREYIAAHDDLKDARYTIDRNEIVNRLNNLTGTAQRINAWQDLIRTDRRRLSTMTAGDNEQRRELMSRIDDEEGNIRSESWSDTVRRYNAGHLSIDRMLTAARRLARGSVGSKDHQSWQDQVVTWTGHKDDQTQNELETEWAKHPGNAGGLLSFLDQRLGRVDQGTPQYEQIKTRRDQVAEQSRNARTAEADNDIEAKRSMSQISDEAYLQYWAKRLKDAPRGSDERRSLKVKVYNETFKVAEQRASDQFQTTKDPAALLDVYVSHQAGMAYGSQGWREMQSAILNLQHQAYGTLSLLRAEPLATAANGGYRYSGGPPPNTPGTGKNGFASQFDGSEFANSNCGYTSAAMLAWAAGVKGLSGGDMRWYAGDPSGASMLSGMATAMERVGLGLEIHNGMDMGAFRRRVANGEAAIVNGLYANLSGPYKLSSFGGAHSVTVTDARKVNGQWWYYTMDPIGRGANAGAQWWPEEVMKGFAWSGARNPISGNTLSGVVSFATHNGRSVRRDARGRGVPFQAFDTDAQGNGTQGKGGGTSRSEAGYMPPDFAEKARGKASSKGIDDVDVNAFLGAVSKIVAPEDMPQNAEQEKHWYSRARKLLERYDGNVQMAGANWITGERTSTDSGSWTPRQTRYANAIGKQFGLAVIPPEGIGVIVPGAQQPVSVGGAASTGNVSPSQVDGTRPINEQTTPGAVVNVGPDGRPAQSPDAPPDAVTTDALAGYSAEAIANAKVFLADSQAPATPDNIMAVITVMATQWGGTDKIDAGNPFNLHTNLPNAYVGQIGLDGDVPVFANKEDAIHAAAADFPQAAIGALRRGSPKAVLDALGGDTPYSAAFTGNNAVHVWNTMPGTRKDYAIDSKLDVPSSLADAARIAPEMADLMNIDPTDPLAKGWFQENLASMKAAAIAGAKNWTFTGTDKSTYEIPFQPIMLVQLGDNAYQHARQLAGIQLASGDAAGSQKTMADALKDFDVASATTQGVKMIWNDIGKQAEAPGLTPIQRRDLYAQRQAMMAQFLGSPPDTYSITNANGMPGQQSVPAADADRITNPELLGADATDEVGTIRDLLASDTKNPYLVLSTKDDQGQDGFDTQGNLNPYRGFMQQTLGADGKLHTLPIVSGDMLRLVKQPDGSEIPMYAAPDSTLAKVVVGGETLYQPIQEGKHVTFFSNQPVSVDRAVSVNATGPQANQGPMEPQTFTGIAAGVRYVEYADPQDPTGLRMLRSWTVDGQTWVITPASETPDLMYKGAGKLAQDGDKIIVQSGGVNGNNKIDPSVDFAWVGVGNTPPSGKSGVGGIGKNYPIVTTGADGSVPGDLTPDQRYSLGGAFWPKDLAKPMAPPPVAAGPTPPVVTHGRSGGHWDPNPIGIDEQPQDSSMSGMSGPADPRDYGDPLHLSDDTSTPSVPRGVPSATPFVAPQFDPVRAAVAVQAQSARDLANASALVARNERLHREAQQLAARNRQAAQLRARQTVTPNQPVWNPVTSPTPRPGPTPKPVGTVAPTPPRTPSQNVAPRQREQVHVRGNGPLAGGV